MIIIQPATCFHGDVAKSQYTEHATYTESDVSRYMQITEMQMQSFEMGIKLTGRPRIVMHFEK